MTDVQDGNAAPAGEDRPFRRLRALVAHASAVERRALALLLARWNFDVIEAADGAEALRACRRDLPDFVICDWMIPVMEAPALCRAIRALPSTGCVYVLLLGCLEECRTVAEGLEAGADDFLSTPLKSGELHARLRAGERILAMQQDLIDKDRRLGEALERLWNLQHMLQRNSCAAARLQRVLLPPRSARCGDARIGTLWLPAGPLGSDLVGYIPVSAGRMAAYSITVCGDGVTSALMTARLAHLFASDRPDESPAIRRLASGLQVPRDPADLAAELNRRVQGEADSDLSFTMVFADVDLQTGLVRFCQAGHPSPAVLRRDGAVEFPGKGGFPVGALPDAVWETETVRVDAGERLVLLSHGITECENVAGERFGDAALPGVLTRTRDLPEPEQIDHLVAAMTAFTGTSNFRDDVSGLVLTIP